MSLDLLVSEVSPLFGGECPCVAIISDCVIILDIISDVIWSSITLRDVSITCKKKTLKLKVIHIWLLVYLPDTAQDPILNNYVLNCA